MATRGVAALEAQIAPAALFRKEPRMNESELGTLAGIIGGGLGALLGINGAVIGLMFSKNFRKHRRFITVNLRVWSYLGLFGVLAGAVLLFGRYPYALWYSCVLLGVILLVLGLILRRAVERREQDAQEAGRRSAGPRRR